MLTRRRSSLAGFIILAVGLVGFSALLLLKSETERREKRFSEYVQNISGIVRNQLDTNEAVLAGFSAFLQAVDQSDTQRPPVMRQPFYQLILIFTCSRRRGR